MIERPLTAHFAELLGLRLDAPGEVSLRIEPRHLNEIGLLLGPVGFALVDYAMAGAAWAAIGDDEAIAGTVSASLNFLASAGEGEVRCRAVLDRRGRSIAALGARVEHEDGRLLITAIGTFAVRPAPA